MTSGFTGARVQCWCPQGPVNGAVPWASVPGPRWQSTAPAARQVVTANLRLAPGHGALVPLAAVCRVTEITSLSPQGAPVG